MTEGVTTHRRTYEDGSQLHSSDPALGVARLNEEVLDQVGRISELYKIGVDTSVAQELSLWVPGVHCLNDLPLPKTRGKDQFQSGLGGLLGLFGKFLHINQDVIFHVSKKPSGLRVQFIGPEADRPNNWHCDVAIVKDAQDQFKSRALETEGRFVVSLDGQLSSDISANLRFVDGDLIVNGIVPEVSNATDWRDLSQGYPAAATVVTRDSGSIITISDPYFSPSTETIRQLDSYILADIGATTLHAPTLIPDSLRVNLQCFYTPLVTQ